MSIITNVEFLMGDLNKDLHPFFDKISNSNNSDDDLFSRIKKYTLLFVDVTQKTCFKGVMHYPKMVFVALAVSSVYSVLFYSLSNLIVLGLNLYFYYKYEDTLFTALRIYHDNDVSELTAPTTEKMKAVGLIAQAAS